ncbi:hypothetical protein PR048_032709 [Dryococelus australis]|uniref:Transposase n=1 Tax=Dryococelus australis TaxID=614101 RepID=A0ABQ9G648_9NEOP|nr:hypothetical protein PR048_032709 [Dryococelus australis]
MAMFMHTRRRKRHSERREASVDTCKQLMRFETDSIVLLSTAFLPESDETRGKALTPRNRMEILLRYVADPGFQSSVTEDFGVERTTLSNSYNTVIDHILDRAHNWIRFPNSATRKERCEVVVANTVPLQRVPKVIASCAMLHNVAKYLNDQFENDEPDVDENGDVGDEDVGQGMNESLKKKKKLQGERKRPRGVVKCMFAGVAACRSPRLYRTVQRKRLAKAAARRRGCIGQSGRCYCDAAPPPVTLA